MNFVESQNILIVFLKIYGFFPINFGGKFRKFKRHLYNFVVSIALATAFAIICYDQLDDGVEFSTEKDSFFAYLIGVFEVFSTTMCFVIIKFYLLVKSYTMENYFDELRDFEFIVRSHHARNTKVDKIIQNLRKSTLRQEIFLFAFYVVTQLGFGFAGTTDNRLLWVVAGTLYSIINCFFVQILIFLKMNMEFARRLQNHINQVLLNLQKLHLHFNDEDFIKIHLKIKQFLSVLSEAFGFIFLMTFLVIYGILIPEIYRSLLTIMQLDWTSSLESLIYSVMSFIWPLLSYYHLGRFVFECDKMEEKVNLYIHRFIWKFI
jgi:hypothetical protein